MEENIYNDDARQYLQMMQENITRMATNSANTKTWLVTIVAAFLAIGSSIDDLHYWLLLALVPIFVLWFMDAYYLRLERGLRNREQYFINIMRGENNTVNHLDALFDFSPLKKTTNDAPMRYVSTECQIFNSSVYPLYLTLILAVVAITVIVNI